jgi:endonuclease/exonuclease/phosphatase family metal-dependent hydrolase
MLALVSLQLTEYVGRITFLPTGYNVQAKKSSMFKCLLFSLHLKLSPEIQFLLMRVFPLISCVRLYSIDREYVYELIETTKKDNTRRMTRILSYNILAGATSRVKQLGEMLQATDADVIGMVEALNPHVIQELAQQLEMHYTMSGDSQHTRDWEVALLSRLPIVHTEVYKHLTPTMRPVLEVTVEEPDGRQITLFVTHLSADFNQKGSGDGTRRREMQALLRVMAPKQGMPHLAMGDFNALAPGDPFVASALLRYIVNMDRWHKQNPALHFGHPHLDFVVPPSLRFLNPLLRLVPYSALLSRWFDVAARVYAPRGTISLVRSAGYVDCFRAINPSEAGFTCPAASPAGRIDFIFASPELAGSLADCFIPTSGGDVEAKEASDHLPVVADFGVKKARPAPMPFTLLEHIGAQGV